jgi:DNA (cytosine-5)-methyltransferase 1|tara:strand:+ start:60 stop:710 length:651 start_codon:yes stop_codon:yes gene_type:complete
MKVLNLYACLGGNRLKWTDCEVTAVELDPELARLYQERFPNDTVIIADAHQYLLDHYKEFDFIWSSPPCPTHSKVRITQKNTPNFKAAFPDMKLYSEIIFLDNYFNGKYCVENVTPYYEPLIPAKKRGRHLYWTNFNLPNNLNERKLGKGKLCGQINEERIFLEKFHKIDLSTYKGKQDKRKIARNLVDYEAGLTIFNTAKGIHKSNNSNQTTLEL